MPGLTIDVTIDGVPYTQEQLARYEYERALHGLHELASLGVEITDGGKTLTPADINWLDPEDARRISFQTRRAMSDEYTLEVFKDRIADTERRWHEWLSVPIAEQGYQTSCTRLHFTGITVQEVQQSGALGAGGDAGKHIMPEHYIVAGSIATGQSGMEVFGMLGEPTHIHGTGQPDIPEGVPVEREPGYPVCLAGETHLASDDLNLHLGAIHEFKPGADGFDMKSTFFAPANAPHAISQGHTIHFAIEIGHMFTDGYNAIHQK